MKIDSHQHFWQYDPQKHSWISDDMKLLRKNFMPEDLESILENNQLDGTVAVQADQSDEETTFLLDLAAKHNLIKGVVGWIDLRVDNISGQLEKYSGSEKLKGFRHVVQGESDPEFMQRPAFEHGISALASGGYTYDILIFSHQLASAIQLVDKFPNQKFVIDHIAKPNIKAAEIDNWKKHMTEIALRENVSCKVSGMVTEADWHQWKNEDFAPYLDVVSKAFGPSRIMYGSDWPVCLLGGTYKEIKNIVDTYFQSFSTSEKDSIYGLNAVQFYNL